MIRWLLLVLLVPVLELVLLVRLAHLVGSLEVLVYLLVAALVGSRMIARPGWLATLGRPYRLGTGSPLTDRIVEIASGVLLILPGILSDLLAAGLLVPPVRARLVRWLAKALPVNFQSTGAAWSGPASRRVDSDEPIDVTSRPTP